MVCITWTWLPLAPCSPSPRRPPQRRPLEQQQQQHEPAGLPRQHAGRRKLRPRRHTELLLLRDPPSRQIGEGTVDWCTWESSAGCSVKRVCVCPVSWSVSTVLLPLKVEHLELSRLDPKVRPDPVSYVSIMENGHSTTLCLRVPL